MATLRKITPCLWFDGQAEEAARLYTDVFPHSSIDEITRYGKAGQEIHGKREGEVLTVAFTLEGHGFTALNGGPQFQFTEAISLQVHCDTQDEIDHYWEHLGDGGPVEAQQCGWLKDRYGVSWQIVPAILPRLMSDPESRERVMQALLQMKKLDIAALEAAHRS